ERFLARLRFRAQRIGGALVCVANAVQAQANQSPRVELAADQMPFVRTEQIAAQLRAHFGRRVEEADAVDAPRPRVRNLDRRRLKRRLEAGLLFQLVDETVA